MSCIGRQILYHCAAGEALRDARKDSSNKLGKRKKVAHSSAAEKEELEVKVFRT